MGPPPSELGVPDSSVTLIASRSGDGETAGGSQAEQWCRTRRYSNGQGEDEARNCGIPVNASAAYDVAVQRRTRGFGGASEAIAHGNKYEAEALRAYADALPGGVTLADGRYCSWRNVGATPDAITSAGVNVEVKCPYYRQLWPQYIPIWYWWQVQAQMEATWLDQTDYVEYSPRTGALNCVRVHRLPAAGALLQHEGSKIRIERQLHPPQEDDRW